MPFFQSRDMFKPLWFILCAVSLVVGCGSDLLTNTLPIQVDNLNRVSPALLLSEVEKADDPKELLDADFQLENHSTLPQSLTLAGKSCSCYGVKLDGALLEPHTPFTIAPASSRVLTFDVAPPAKPEENSWTVRLASGDDPQQELHLTLRVRVHADVRLEPDAIITTTPSASAQNGPGPPSAEQHELVVRHTWRGEKEDGGFPALTGLPTGWEFTNPIASEEPLSTDDDLWQQIWLTTVQFRKPDAGNEQHGLMKDPSQLEIRLKPVPEMEAQRTIGSRRTESEAGIHHMKVSFENRAGEVVSAYGRLVVREPSGIVAPSVIHWGNILVDASQFRRVMLTAGDDRAFSVLGLTLDRPANDERTLESSSDGMSAEGQLETHSATQTWRVQTTDFELAVSMDAAASGTQQSLHFDFLPHHEGQIDETLIINTDHPLTPTVQIRLMAIVTPAEAETSVLTP
ncbi:MAG: hypothetical protein KDA86_14480 [Planctomycetaceae bacterium]|nr:hypothetical protein [Planctomycetaceae bacterium]